MDKVLAARRLSAAIGVEIKPSQIERVSEEGFVKLTEGTSFFLAGGNAVYKGPVMGDTVSDFQHGYWIRNGKVWNVQPGERIRPLPGRRSTYLITPRHRPHRATVSAGRPDSTPDN